MLRLGMVGLGAISRFYTAALHRIDEATLVAVCDIENRRVEPYRSAGVAVYEDYQTMLNSPDLDGVIIATPNDQHFTIARAALISGKHVCCEKPLSTRLTDARELAQCSDLLGKVLFTAFHRRYNRNLLDHAAQLRGRTKIASVTANYREDIRQHVRPDSWYLDPARCAGCIADNGPNVFDMLRYFLGGLEIERVEVVRQNGIDIRADLWLASEDGIMIKIHLDWQYKDGDRKDLTVRLKDETFLFVDLLGGYSGFKQSLWHEYEGVLSDFAARVRAGWVEDFAGIDAARLVEAVWAKAEYVNE
jgi:L-arabinose 1- dehydrogenase